MSHILNMFWLFIQHAQAPEALGVQRLALWQEEGVAGPKWDQWDCQRKLSWVVYFASESFLSVGLCVWSLGQHLYCVVFVPQASRSENWWRMDWSSENLWRFTPVLAAARTHWHAARDVTWVMVGNWVVVEAAQWTQCHFIFYSIYRFPPVQVRERVPPMLVCQRSCHGCGAWESCVVFFVATGSPRKLTGTCKCEYQRSSLVNKPSVLLNSNFRERLWDALRCFLFPPGTTVSIWGPRVMSSKTNASWWSTSTNWRQIRLARSF